MESTANLDGDEGVIDVRALRNERKKVLRQLGKPIRIVVEVRSIEQHVYLYVYLYSDG